MDFNTSITNLPGANSKRIALRINSLAQHALRMGHPWVFDQSITEQSHAGAPGDLAVIFDDKRNFLAVGLYDPTSPIRVRILQSRQPATINREWFKTRLLAASNVRIPLTIMEKATSGYRLVNGENDGFPGLVIDKYDQTLVIKLYTPAWIPHLKEVCLALEQVSPASSLVLRLSRSMSKQPGLLSGLQDGQSLAGPPLAGPILFMENGLIFEADPIFGQKTGFFLDQRDNRARVERLSMNKTVLNMFAYTGGFSVYAARGGAKHIVSVDISAPAMESAVRNMGYNQQGAAQPTHETLTEDAFEVLTRLTAAKRTFGLVIIDPPMFAQSQGQTSAAIAAYQRLTHLGLGVLERGGVLVQASCSSRVDSESFFKAIHQAARQSNRSLTEIERTGHALDHPIGFKDGAYLKCLFTRVS